MHGWLKGEVARAVEFLVNRLADWCRQLPSPPPPPFALPLEESRGKDTGRLIHIATWVNMNRGGGERDREKDPVEREGARIREREGQGSRERCICTRRRGRGLKFGRGGVKEGAQILTNETRYRPSDC